MSQPELLGRVAEFLSTQHIPVMLTGSLVSSLQGEPRATHDIDLVVPITADQVLPLLHAFPAPDYYLSQQAMADAIAHKRMFNLLDLNNGDKVDFWLLTDDPFDISRFSRKQPQVIENTLIDISTPEDTILAKLKWCQAAGGSEKQFRDALRVYEVQGQRLDDRYISEWVQKLGLQDLFARLLSEAEPLP